MAVLNGSAEDPEKNWGMRGADDAVKDAEVAEGGIAAERRVSYLTSSSGEEGAAPAAMRRQSSATNPSFREDSVKRVSDKFVELTPMLVMPWVKFKEQGCCPRSDVAATKELLVRYDEKEHVAIFVSHNWWQTSAAASRVETQTGTSASKESDDDEAPSSPRSPAKMKFDSGLPDYTSGEKANLKFRVLLSGVAALIQKDGLDEAKVVLWME